MVISRIGGVLRTGSVFRKRRRVIRDRQLVSKGTDNIPRDMRRPQKHVMPSGTGGVLRNIRIRNV